MKFWMKRTKALQPVVKRKQTLTSKEVDKTKPQIEKNVHEENLDPKNMIKNQV